MTKRKIHLLRSMAIPAECPTIIDYKCPVCGIVTGSQGSIHPNARGIGVEYDITGAVSGRADSKSINNANLGHESSE